MGAETCKHCGGAIERCAGCTLAGWFHLGRGGFAHYCASDAEPATLAEPASERAS